jgi:hypothetical protein
VLSLTDSFSTQVIALNRLTSMWSVMIALPNFGSIPRVSNTVADLVEMK